VRFRAYAQLESKRFTEHSAGHCTGWERDWLRLFIRKEIAFLSPARLVRNASLAHKLGTMLKEIYEFFLNIIGKLGQP
jgi:hypothetical protein